MRILIRLSKAYWKSLRVYRPFGAFVLVTDICFLPTSFFPSTRRQRHCFQRGRLSAPLVCCSTCLGLLFSYLVCLLVYLSGSLFISSSAFIGSVCLLFYLSGCSPINLSAYLFCLLVYLSGFSSISLSAYPCLLPAILSDWLLIYRFI